jgi:hypothetical protein
MGIYTINCPSCKQPHEWCSAFTDQRCYRCKYDGSGPVTPQDKINALEEHVDKLESELRQMKLRSDHLAGVAARCFKKIRDLTNVAKVNDEFIELQSRRLINARNHITRVRAACNELEPADSGESLYP